MTNKLAQEMWQKFQESESIQEKIIKKKYANNKSNKEFKFRHNYSKSNNIEVFQGAGEIGKKNTLLCSEGFSICNAILLKNNTTGKIAFLHIEPRFPFVEKERDIMKKIDKYYDHIEQKKFSKDDIEGFLIYRKDRIPTLMYEYLTYRKYKIKGIVVYPGIDDLRGIAYDPKINKIMIHTKQDDHDQLTYYKGFSEKKKTKNKKKAS